MRAKSFWILNANDWLLINVKSPSVKTRPMARPTVNSTSDSPRGDGPRALRAVNEYGLIAVMGIEPVTVRRAQRCDANHRSHQSVPCRRYSVALPGPRNRHVPATRH